MTEQEPTNDLRGGDKMPRAILAISTIALSWLLMQVIHETGHVCGAFVSGGSVQRVILVPWEFSRTDLSENPRPLITCWAGPIIGAVVPVIVWLIARALRWRIAFWFRFLAGFCLIANGSYLAAGTIAHEGDAGDLLRYGASPWTIWLFAAVTVPAGFIAWNGLGSQFGIGKTAIPIRWQTAWISVFTLSCIVITEIICASWMTD